MNEDEQNAEPCQTLLDLVPDMVYVLDSEFCFTFVNDAMVEGTGYTSEELLGASASLLFDDKAIREATWNRDQLRTGDIEFGRLETELKTAHGERIPCEIRGQLLSDHDDDRVTGTVGVVRDITERKERERELQARSAAMSASIDGMAILDTDETYIFANQSHADIYGYTTPDAFLGETWRICYPEDELTRFEETVMPTLFEEGKWRGEAVGACEDGRTFPQELSLSLTDDGRVICVVRDITERKQREQELEDKKEALEEFTGVVSHDLRNPLGVAQGRVELAKRESDSEHLDIAADAIERSLDLIDDLLTLSQEGTRAGETEPVDLGNIAPLCWQNIETEDASLVVETEEMVQADPSRLKDLVENLIRNAVKHGASDVTVTIDDHDRGFYIADDGSGIPDEKRDQIFESGYSTAEEGTGFGLDIVKKIADAHGWDIHVTESEAGGARFDFVSMNSRR